MNSPVLEVVKVGAARLPERARWADGLAVRLPSQLARLLDRAGACFDEPATRTMVSAIASELRTRAAFTPAPPASARLPVSYHTFPAPMRQLLARVIGTLQRARRRSWSRFPGWPLDLSADFAADLAGRPGPTFSRTPVLLTHDIDSAEGLENLVRMFLPLEETVGARSASYVVPCAWPIDHGLLAEVQRRGHEIGVHGYDHANRTPYLEPAERRRRLAAGRAFGDRYGATGYRAPSLVRTTALLADLARLYRYDSSIPTSGGAFPVGNNGCASARPWRLGGLWEIPLTLPRDGSLRFLGYSPNQIGRLWRETAETIARSGGLISLLVHCEAGFSGNKRMLAIYHNFMEWAKNEPRFEFFRPVDLVEHLESIPDGCAR